MGRVHEPAQVPVTGAGGPEGSKSAVTERSWFIVTLHAPFPEHAPLQPAKVEPGAAVAVSWGTATGL